MHNCEDSLKRIYFNVRLFRENKDISNKKYSRAYYLYNNIFEISVKRIIETKIIDIILRNRLNFIKRLFNILIR